MLVHSWATLYLVISTSLLIFCEFILLPNYKHIILLFQLQTSLGIKFFILIWELFERFIMSQINILTKGKVLSERHARSMTAREFIRLMVICISVIFFSHYKFRNLRQRMIIMNEVVRLSQSIFSASWKVQRKEHIITSYPFYFSNGIGEQMT